jgi:putative ABC transport system permease protein
MLLKNPEFTSIALLALVLGIGANTAIFSVVNAVLLRSFPFPDPQRLVMIWEKSPRQQNNVLNPQNFRELQQSNHSFERMAAFIDSNVNITGDGNPEHVPGAYITRDFFPVLGVQPVLGRNFASAEDGRSHGFYALLSQELWQRRYGSDPHILGRKMILGGDPVTVVGVIPARFRFPEMKAQLWILYVPKAEQPSGRFLSAIGRLKPGVTPTRALADLQSIHAGLIRRWPDFNSKWGVTIVGLREQFAGPMQTPLLILLGAVGFVLLIACVNVANLTLIRASGRQRELAVRAALGATRVRLVRQLLIESALLSLLGGSLGFGFSIWVKDGLLTLLPDDLSVATVNQVSVDVNVLAFTIGLSLLTGLLFGALPAWRSSRVELVDTLKEAGRGDGSGRSRNRLRALLAAGETAFALILLIGAGLLIKSLWLLQHVPPGFQPERLLSMRVELEGPRYDKPEQKVEGLDEIIAGLERLPGVTAVGSIVFPPMSRAYSATGFWVAVRPKPRPGDEPVGTIAVTSRDYTRAMGIPLLSGRGFSPSDRLGSPLVVLVNRELVRQQFSGMNPLGQRLAVEWDTDQPREIVGVVGDVRQKGLDDPVAATIYLPDSQVAAGGGTIMLRTALDPLGLAQAARDSVHRYDPDLAIADIQPMKTLVEKTTAKPRFESSLLAGFALLALLLASIGVFGVMAYSVQQRTNEIGIRLALGASSHQILAMLLAEGGLVTVLGLGAGLLGAFALTRFLRSLLFQVSPTDPATFIAVPLVLGLVALFACYLPALRALRVDPAAALRYE